MVRIVTPFALAALSFLSAQAFDLDVSNDASIKSVASDLASEILGYYNQSNIVGTLPSQYYWWESGAMFDTLIQYWHLTGDAQYNDIVTQGLLAQQGANSDFLPANETKNEGNDDEGQWALAALSAAESQLPEPAGVSWVGLAENVFNNMAARWDTTNCDGGLRWQIFPFLTGYDYKNSVSNAYFFQLASRLALYTGNSTYSDWASKTFDWVTSAGFIDTKYNVYDGAHVESNCTDINKIQFSYVAGAFISGAAHMYNSTSGDVKWETALNGLLNRTSTVFFPNDVASEIACQNHDTCTVDMKAFKGLLAHWLVDTVQVAPYTSQKINLLLSTTAEAAAKSCDSTGCPLVWDGSVTGKVDGAGVGEVMSALSFVQGLLVSTAAAPIKEGESVNATTTSSGATGTGTGNSTTSVNSNTAVATGPMGMGILIGLVGLIAVLSL